MAIGRAVELRRLAALRTILGGLSRGLTVEDACAEAGIAARTFQEWVRSGEYDIVLDEVRQKWIESCIYPTRSIFLLLQSDGGLLLVPRDCDGRIPTWREWLDLAIAVDRFYREVHANNIKLVGSGKSLGSEPESQARPRERAGFIYLLKGAGYHKIGLSRREDPTERIKEFSPKLPFETRVVYTFAVDDCFAAETYLHKKFADKRANGEWFNLSQEDIAWVKEWDGNHG